MLLKLLSGYPPRANSFLQSEQKYGIMPPRPPVSCKRSTKPTCTSLQTSSQASGTATLCWSNAPNKQSPFSSRLRYNKEGVRLASARASLSYLPILTIRCPTWKPSSTALGEFNPAAQIPRSERVRTRDTRNKFPSLYLIISIRTPSRRASLHLGTPLPFDKRFQLSKCWQA